MSRSGSAGRAQWRYSRLGRLVTAGDEEDRRRRLLAVVLLVALLIVGGIAAIFRASPAHHPAASPGPVTRPPAGLVGGGDVPDRRLSGRLVAHGAVGDVLFAEDGTVIDHDALQVIGTAARAIRDTRPAVVTITGYTDAIGGAPANNQLSLQRARAVARVLERELSGQAIQYRVAADGSGRPVAVNSTPAGRQLNRRVVIVAG